MSYKVELENSLEDRVKMRDLRDRVLAIVDDPISTAYNGSVVLNEDDGTINLSDPRGGWWDKRCNLLCRVLPKGAKVILTVE